MKGGRREWFGCIGFGCTLVGVFVERMEWDEVEWELRGETKSEREYGEYRIDKRLVWIGIVKIIQAISVGEVDLLRDLALFIQYRYQFN